LDKSEYKLRAEEIKDLISRGEYAQAAEIADTIDWRRVKSVMMLCTISDLYKINRRYEDARDMLLLAYERRPGGRTICYSLCELSIKMEEYVQAIEYYKEFVQVAPKDPGRYILQYKLYEAQDVSLEERIAVLEELKKRDYREKWAYELAYLYHRVGLAARCVEECDELILWFGEGKYVIKAMELKMLHQPLTPEQQEKYDHRFDAPGTQQYSQNYAQDPGYGQNETYDPNQGYVQDGSYDPNQGYAQGGSYDPNQGYAQDGSYDPNQGYAQDGSYDPNQGYAQDGSYDSNPDNVQEGAYDQVIDDTRVYEPVQPQQAPAQPAEDDFDIHVKTMDVGQYNTINLQAELAAGLREVLSEDHAKETSDSITRSIVAPMIDPGDSDTESLDYPEIADVSEDDLEPETEQMESSEVFFGETGEIGDLSQVPQVETEEILPEEPVVARRTDVVPELSEVQKTPEVQEIVKEPETQKVPEASRTQEIHEVTASAPAAPVAPVTPAAPVEPPKELADVLAQESDGQISLVMPEAESIEKQITGQMNIEDILAEWERKKKENLEKREEEVRQHVLQQTGAMFTEFEQAVRDGLLEKLEKEKAADTADTVAEDTTDTDEVEELEEITEEPATEEPVEELTEAAPAEEAEQEPVEELPEEDTVEELAEEPAYEPEAEEFEEPAEPEAEIYEQEEIIDEEQAEPEEAMDDEPVEEPTAEAVESVDEETASEEIELTAEETPEAGEAPEQPERPAVERDKAKVRALTREERELYAPFIQSRSAREQLVKAIDNISLAAYTGNVIITGEEGMDTLSLAKNMVREIQATDSNFSGKVAKISGHALNKKDTADTLSKLKNGALIICKASEMNDATANVLHKALQQESQGIVIILEDTKRDIDKFLEKHEKLRECFTARMDVEALSNNTLVAFGKQYAREMEYSIDELGELALHTRIEDMQTIDHVVTVVDVKQIVDEAINHANKKTLKHFFDVLFAKRYDDEDMIILTEKDFV
jgi:tetratricopeptide (TPR) repeat protein